MLRLASQILKTVLQQSELNLGSLSLINLVGVPQPLKMKRQYRRKGFILDVPKPLLCVYSKLRVRILFHQVRHYVIGNLVWGRVGLQDKVFMS